MILNCTKKSAKEIQFWSQFKDNFQTNGNATTCSAWYMGKHVNMNGHMIVDLLNSQSYTSNVGIAKFNLRYGGERFNTKDIDSINGQLALTRSSFNATQQYRYPSPMTNYAHYYTTYGSIDMNLEQNNLVCDYDVVEDGQNLTQTQLYAGAQLYSNNTMGALSYTRD